MSGHGTPSNANFYTGQLREFLLSAAARDVMHVNVTPLTSSDR
jgi:hypothetical protein